MDPPEQPAPPTRSARPWTISLLYWAVALPALALAAFVVLAPERAYLLKGSALTFAFLLTVASALVLSKVMRPGRRPRLAVGFFWLFLGPAWLATVTFLAVIQVDHHYCAGGYAGCPPRRHLGLCRRIRPDLARNLAECEARYATERPCTRAELDAIRSFDCGGWGDLQYVPIRLADRLQCGPQVCRVP